MKLTPSGPGQGLEAHQGVDEGLAPGLPPLQRHLHMAQGVISAMARRRRWGNSRW